MQDIRKSDRYQEYKAKYEASRAKRYCTKIRLPYDELFEDLVLNPCESLERMSNRLGCTKQAIGFVYVKYIKPVLPTGLKSKNRQVMCTLKSNVSQLSLRPDNEYAAIAWDELIAAGYSVQRVLGRALANSNRRIVQPRILWVEGKICKVLVRTALNNPISGYYHIRGIAANIDFYLVYISREDLWLIVPGDKLPFYVRSAEYSYNRQWAKDYKALYEGRWDLLKRS